MKNKICFKSIVYLKICYLCTNFKLRHYEEFSKQFKSTFC